MDRSHPVRSSPKGGQATNTPRAIIHKKILDAASDQPEATVEELAADVSGASVVLVEQVLERYGNPGANQSVGTPAGSDDTLLEATPQNPANDTMTSRDEAPDSSTDIEYLDLSEEQQHLLRTIYDHPDAAVEELAERQDVSQSRLRQSLESIPNFEWERRRELVENLFENTRSRTNGTDPSHQTRDTLTEQVNVLIDNVESLERKLDSEPADPDGQFADPKLLQKVIHACISSDRIEEDEELAIIENLVQ